MTSREGREKDSVGNRELKRVGNEVCQERTVCQVLGFRAVTKRGALKIQRWQAKKRSKRKWHCQKKMPKQMSKRNSSRQTAGNGNRITPEHSSKHQFGTQPFWHSFGTQNDTFCLPAVNTHNIRFNRGRKTLEASRVPKRYLYQAKEPIQDFVLTSSLPLSCLLFLSEVAIESFFWGEGASSELAI